MRPAPAARIDDWPPAAAALQRGHHGIYDAIAARDPETAEKRTESHIRGFHDIAQNLLSQPAAPSQP
jgi:DNA-binding FadR family transcriptional regulator